MPPVRLTDSELDSVMAAARPLPVERRDAFLQAVAGALQGCEVIGPGLVARICAEVQPRFLPAAAARSGCARPRREISLTASLLAAREPFASPLVAPRGAFVHVHDALQQGACSRP
jgi:hypothetical protein